MATTRMADAAWEVPAFAAAEFGSRSSRHAIVIPVLNEAPRIHDQLARMRDTDEDVIVVDGGSKDGSGDAELLRELGVTTLLMKTGPGRLAAQERIGFAWVLEHGYEGVIRMDGNDKDDPSSIRAIIEALDMGFDFVQGSRFIAGGEKENTPTIRRLAIRIVHAPWISLIAGERFTDTTNAFRGHSRRYLEHPEVQPFRDVFQSYELLAYLSVRASQVGLRTCEVPVGRSYPADEVPTKISHVRGNLELLRTLVRLSKGEFDPEH